MRHHGLNTLGMVCPYLAIRPMMRSMGSFLKWTFYDCVAEEEVGQTVHVNTT